MLVSDFGDYNYIFSSMWLMGLGSQGGPAAPQLQNGIGPVMKPEMRTLLATAAGNNGLFDCSTFFPSCFSSQVCYQMMYLLEKKKTKRKQNI